MILPTPEFDPMFADDGVPFRDKMVDYIRREFADIPGVDARLRAALGDPDRPCVLPAAAAPSADRRAA